MTRQRAFQRKWADKGLCGYCKDHPPIYLSGACKSCYSKWHGGRLPKPHGPKGALKMAELQKSIAKHRAWIKRYTQEIKELKAAKLTKGRGK